MDSNKSISNSYSKRGSFPVYLMDDCGSVWKEENYEGYGVFDGVDFFELLATMNGFETREDGLMIWSGKLERPDGGDIFYPNLVEDENWEWVNEKPEDCDQQGFFY